MKRQLALVLVTTVMAAPVSPPYEKAVAQSADEPPSISLHITDTFGSEGSRDKLNEVQLGKSYYQEQQDGIKREQEKKTAELSAKKKLSATKKTATQDPDLGIIQSLAKQLIIQKWSAAEWSAFDFIVSHESGWNPKALNKSSGACGLGQALPCSKMPGGTGASEEQQITWVINYISSRYGTPTKAQSFWLSHNWY